MSSKIRIDNIIHRITRDSSEITITEINAGKLQARTITNEMSDGKKIDVLITKKRYHDTRDKTVEFDENDIRNGSRRTFTELKEFFKVNGRIPVHADFFKLIENGDKIEIILHY